MLVGDFLYSRAFQMMNDIGHLRVLSVMADATNMIAEGELLQLMNCGDPETTEIRYLEVIKRKTAMLFEAGTRMAAILAGQPEPVETALADYGQRLGIAFQLVDDALDYSSSADELGKNLGDDFRERKLTLPVIKAVAKAEESNSVRLGEIQQMRIETLVQNGADLTKQLLGFARGGKYVVKPMDINQLLLEAASKNASDLHLAVGDLHSRYGIEVR